MPCEPTFSPYTKTAGVAPNPQGNKDTAIAGLRHFLEELKAKADFTLSKVRCITIQEGTGERLRQRWGKHTGNDRVVQAKTEGTNYHGGRDADGGEEGVIKRDLTSFIRDTF